MSAIWTNWSYMVLGVPISRCSTNSPSTIHRLGVSGRSKMRWRASRASTSWSSASSPVFRMEHAMSRRPAAGSPGGSPNDSG